MRWLIILFASLAIAPVLAQTSSDASRQLDVGKKADLENWAWRAQRGKAPTESERTLQAVLDAVAKRDCAAAVQSLNAGLSKAFPEVATLAGAMYEEGICLKQNWDRAVSLYERAFTAGHVGAAARAAAGYATPVGGRDAAASLWWALRAKTALPAECAKLAPLAEDADRFVAALKAWPADQLQACVYSAAVMATIQGEAESAGLAAAYGLQGKVTLSFAPVRGRIDIKEELVAAPITVVLTDAAKRESDQQAARVAFSGYLRQTADRALKRFDKPAGIPSTWRLEATYVYKTEG